MQMKNLSRLSFEEHVAQDGNINEHIRRNTPSVKFIQSVFPSLVETAVTKNFKSVKCWKEKDQGRTRLR